MLLLNKTMETKTFSFHFLFKIILMGANWKLSESSVNKAHTLPLKIKFQGLDMFVFIIDHLILIKRISLAHPLACGIFIVFKR